MSMTDKHDEKDGGKKKSRLDGLGRMSVQQLTELHEATGKELARRAKETAKKKSPSQMSDKEFSAWSKREMDKNEKGDDDDGE
jgi:hypothetical protein